ncbi:MAG TPA: hypothetical protein VK983_04745, partial [Candidatus Limnocylindrales bacterium]|nr:hypothetical protein [Candidatus Limnocylindrales bacterium]
MKRIKEFLQAHYAEILLVLAGLTLLFLLLGFRLGSLTFGNAADVEVASKQAGSSWYAIIDNPLNAPYKAMQRLALYTGLDGITIMRAVSAVWAVGAIILFYLVARQWHS